MTSNRQAGLLLCLTFIVMNCMNSAVAQEKPECTQEYMEIKPAEVVALCERALQQPADAKTRSGLLYLKGRGLHRSGQRALAIQAYEEALKLDENNPELHISRSWAGFSSGDAEAFFRHAEIAHQLAPQNPRMWDLVGFALMQTGDLEAALEAYATALDIDPAQPFALLHRSQLFEGMKRPLDALNDLNRLIEIPPHVVDRAGLLNAHSMVVSFHTEALLSRGHLFKELGRNSAAQRDFERALAWERSEKTILALAQHIKMDPTQVALFETLTADAVAISPNNIRAVRLRAFALERAKRYPEAVEILGRVIELAPKDAQAHFTRAIMFKSLNRFDEVANEFAKAFEKDQRILQSLMGSMVMNGHWKGAPVPTTLDEPLRKALLACAKDPLCI
jgi:Flp pilus assembly protein TadD